MRNFLTGQVIRATTATVTCVLGLTLTTFNVSATPIASWPKCPEVVIVAARGSEQNDNITPTRYSATAPAEFSSNGYEAENIQGLLHLVERRYGQTHHGASVMDSVAVLGLDAQAFPAQMYLPRLGEEGEELPAGELANRIGGILSSVPLPELVNRPIREAVTGINQGIDSLPSVIEQFEQTSGCKPDYLYTGFSQGAVVLGSQEQLLFQQGRLRGSVYLGDPTFSREQLGAQDVLVGNPIVGKGLIHQLPPSTPEREAVMRRHALAQVPHVYYCVAGDYACDTSAETVAKSLQEQGGPHVKYFLGAEPNLEDTQVADAVIDLIE